jgi:hypothetical protein
VTPEKTAAEPRWWRQHGLKLLASLLIGAAFYFLLVAGGLPLLPEPTAWRSVEWWAVGGYALCWALVHVLRAGRWYFLLAPLERVPLLRVMTVASVGFAAVLLLPLRTGEVVRPLMITRRTKLSVWAASGSVGAERVIDGLLLSSFLFAALQLTEPLNPLPERIGNLSVTPALVPQLAYAALSLFAIVFLVMGAFYWRRAWVLGAIELALGLLSKRLASWVARRVTEVASGLRFLPKPRYAAPFLLVSLAYWAVNASGSWLLAQGCGLHGIGYAEACVLMGVLGLGILAPSAPGFFGAFQLSVYAGLALYVPAADVVGAGSAYVFLLYASQLAITVVLAACALVVHYCWKRQGEILPDPTAS